MKYVLHEIVIMWCISLKFYLLYTFRHAFNILSLAFERKHTARFIYDGNTSNACDWRYCNVILQFYLILTFLLATRRYVYLERICRSHFFSILSRKWIGCQYFPENCSKHLAQEQFVDLWINKKSFPNVWWPIYSNWVCLRSAKNIKNYRSVCKLLKAQVQFRFFTKI